MSSSVWPRKSRLLDLLSAELTASLWWPRRWSIVLADFIHERERKAMQYRSSIRSVASFLESFWPQSCTPWWSPPRPKLLLCNMWRPRSLEWTRRRGDLQSNFRLPRWSKMVCLWQVVLNVKEQLKHHSVHQCWGGFLHHFIPLLKIVVDPGHFGLIWIRNLASTVDSLSIFGLSEQPRGLISQPRNGLHNMQMCFCQPQLQPRPRSRDFFLPVLFGCLHDNRYHTVFCGQEL